jgi:hypothetical protein
MLTDIREAINVYRLDPSLFRKTLEEIANRHISGNLSLEEKMICCMEVANTSNMGEENKSIVALSIHFRLEALANYLASGGASGFRHKGLLGSDMLDPGIVTCAALEPLIQVSGQVTFEAASFEQRLLAIVKTVGSA